MADKKITALTAVADSAIGADDLLHIVDNPGGTPVNKKMTIAQLFSNVPNAIAVDDITVLTAAAVNLSTSFVTDFNGGAFTAQQAFTLDDGSYTGQLKIIYMSTYHASSYNAVVTIATPLSASLDVLTFNAQGDAAILIWNGSLWITLAHNSVAIA